MDDSGSGRLDAARFGAGRFGYDGTQPPPPPPAFPDPLAGLVTGERYETKAVPPIVLPTPMPVPQPGPAYVPPTRRAHARGSGRDAVRAPARHVSGEPEAHAPHVGLARDQPRQDAVQQVPVPQTSVPQASGQQWQGQPGPGQEAPKKNKSGLIGCLVVLAALSGLLFNVVREIIEAVVDLVR